MINEKGEFVDIFVENKAHALKYLAHALSETRQGEHVRKIKLSEDGTTAYICNMCDEILKTVNVDCDGALQAMIDVCKALL